MVYEEVSSKRDIQPICEALGEIVIEDLDLSVRTYNCFILAGIRTVSDLYNKLNEGLSSCMKIRHLTRECMVEMLAVAKSVGYPLDSEMESFPNLNTANDSLASEPSNTNPSSQQFDLGEGAKVSNENASHGSYVTNGGLENTVCMVRMAIEGGHLTERESKVLDMRFGITDGCAHTLEEIGEHFGVTRERIRQIEAKALRKIRHPNHCVGPKNDFEKSDETHDPDEILAQCIADNGVALGTPAQFSMCAVGISEDADMTLITRGNHLFVTLRIDRGNEDTRATLDFFHFNSKDIFELISLSAKGYTMIAQIDKQHSRKGDLRITPLKVFCDNPGTEVLLCTRLLELFTPIAEMALSVLNQVLNSKCNGMSVKDFGYSNFE